MEIISSTANATIKYVKSLKQKKFRGEYQAFFVEGLRFSMEALQSGWDIQWVLMTEEFFKEHGKEPLLQAFAQKSIQVTEKILKELSETEHPQGILTVVSMQKTQTPDYAGKRLLLLDCLQDPGNMGTIIRTADAFAFDGILVSEGCVDVYNGKVLRATMGSIFHIPIWQVKTSLEAVEGLKAAGYSVYATHLQGENMASEQNTEDKIALIIGNEGKGIAPEVAQAADKWVKIPMPGRAESLNASVAAAIFMYTMMNEERKAGV